MRPDAAAVLVRRMFLAALLLVVPGCSGIFDSDTILTLEVAEARVLCMGVGPRECLLVRDRPGADYQLFYDWIEGFDFEPGYRYQLRVERRRVKHPPADGSSYEYRLIRMDSKLPSPRMELLERVWQAESEWESAHPVTYTMVQERECFCPPEGRGPVRMEVTRAEGSWISPFERVVSQQYVADGRDVPFELNGLFLSVQQLFSYVRYAIASDANVIDIEIDDAAGFPRRVFVDWDAGIADDEFEYFVLSLDPV